MINRKHVLSVMVIVAGNDITKSLADIRRLLTFPRLGPFIIYDSVRRLYSVVFHRRNNKTVRQKKPAHEAGTSVKESVIDDPCVSQDTRHS